MERIVALLYKVVKGEDLSNAEQDELDEWIAKSPHNRSVYDEVTNPVLVEKELKRISAYDKNTTWKKIKAGIKSEHPQSKLVFFSRSNFGKYAAAITLFILLAGSYFLFIKPPSSSNAIIVDTNSTATRENDIAAPTDDKAILVLSDGRKVVLDNASNRTLAQDRNIEVISKDGLVSYTISGSDQSKEAAYHTIITPRGGQHRLQLADGSRVWLNAASSIRYPVAFTGNERKVEITGEAYFEVTKDAARKFIVRSGDAVTEVLGTHFNVNSYADEENIKITLLEGKVKVSNSHADKLLAPHQQAVLLSAREIKLVKAVDVARVLAWQRGMFEFNDTRLEVIMRQIGRWYDIDIVYEGKPGDTKFGGGISRQLPLSKVLKSLEDNGIEFQLEGKVLRVKP